MFLCPLFLVTGFSVQVPRNITFVKKLPHTRNDTPIIQKFNSSLSVIATDNYQDVLGHLPNNESVTPYEPLQDKIWQIWVPGSRRVVAIECLKDPTTRRHILKIGILVRNEMIAMCTDARGSILRSQSSSAFKEFSWDTLLCEAAETAPLLLNILQECVRPRTL